MIIKKIFIYMFFIISNFMTENILIQLKNRNMYECVTFVDG